MLALKDFQEEDFENVLKRPAFCQKEHHEKEELKFFCEICEVAICNVCAWTDHEGHGQIHLEEAANERKLQVKSVIESQKQRIQHKTNKIVELKETCIKIRAQVASVKRDVQMCARNIIALVEAKEHEIISKVEKEAEESLDKLDIRQDEMEHQIQMIKHAIEDSEIRLKRSTSADIVQLDKSFDTIFQKGVSDDEEKEVDCDLESLRQFIFVQNETMDRINTEGIGSFKTFLSKTKPQQSSAEGTGIVEAIVGLEAQFVLTTRNAEGKRCYAEERDHVRVEIKTRQGHDCAAKVQLQDNKDGTYRISYFVQEAGIWDASVKVNGESVCGSPFIIHVRPRQFKPTLSFGQRGSSVEMFSGAWGVAVDERSDIIAVTENINHRVQVFSSDGSYLRAFGAKGDQQGEFNCPTGIAFDVNENIIVADSNNHRVEIFSKQGEYLSQFGGKGSLDHQLIYPYGLSVDSNENIIVADRGNRLIKIFSSSGQILLKSGEDFFADPVHCIQIDKYLVVSDSESNCIKFFDRQGKFLYKFGKEGEGDGEFKRPGCLSVDKAGHLMVCDESNHRVQLFELSGKFVTKFGKKGSEMGEFDFPISSGVFSDGRIVVCDSLNYRIQMFE